MKQIYKWAITATIFTFILSSFFSVISEYFARKASVLVSSFFTVFFILVNVITDTVGMSISNVSLTNIINLAKNNIKGAKESVILVKNSDKISNICSDIIGDICGILSGALGSVISLKIACDNFYVAVLISSLIASLTVFLKAIGKNLALNKSTEITIFTAKVIKILLKKHTQ